MKQSPVKVDPYLLSALNNNESFNHFTVTQLRDAYLTELGPSHDPIEARKFIYRQVLRFVRLGLFKKEAARNNRESKYYKTAKYSGTKFESRSIHLAKKLSNTSKDTSDNNHASALCEIKEQLKQYKVDLLASVGESEEYMRLYQSNPEFKPLLESEYHQAREQSSKLLGQIKALKTVLTHYSN
jgi:hypothetical protein